MRLISCVCINIVRSIVGWACVLSIRALKKEEGGDNRYYNIVFHIMTVHYGVIKISGKNGWINREID